MSMEKHAMNSIQVCVVDSTNIMTTWSELQKAINSADCIAIDLEMSGIGTKQSLRAPSIDDRYNNLRQSATNHSILSIGIACFNTVNQSSNLIINSNVFDIMLFSQIPYTIDPCAVSFLLRHGFNFNAQYSNGIPYTPAFSTNEQSKGTDNIGYSIKELFLELISTHKPIILHNGLIDLMYMYHHLYAPLPTNLSVFVADLADMFQGGIYDTKRIPLSTIIERPTYLEYLLHKSWQINSSNCSNGRRHIVIETSHCPSFVTVKLINRSLKNTNRLLEICEDYASHGYCSQLSTCPRSHNISHVIEKENGEELSPDKDTCGKEEVPIERMDVNDVNGVQPSCVDPSCVEPSNVLKRRKRKRKRDKRNSLEKLFSEELKKAKKRFTETTERQHNGVGDTEEQRDLGGQHNGVGDTEEQRDLGGQHNGVEDPEVHHQSNRQEVTDSITVQSSPLLCSHKSGCDAFATGFYFLQTALTQATSDNILTIDNMVYIQSDHKNKVNINGKQIPLLITKSQYCNNSINHKKIQLRMKQSIKL